uniref:Uncharacterized protein n=1 Tax=Anguilla anguilla TaxID=7936 RepID=A0A0E9R855_ANGAN
MRKKTYLWIRDGDVKPDLGNIHAVTIFEGDLALSQVKQPRCSPESKLAQRTL